MTIKFIGNLLPLAGLLLITACGGGGGGPSSSEAASKTAPGITVVPQAAYETTSGGINTERVNAVQSSYQQQGARQVGDNN